MTDRDPREQPTVPDPARRRGDGPAPTGAGAATDDLAPGTVLADRYRIVSRIGAGGMGTVYRAEDLRLSQQVALKFLRRPRARVGVDDLAGFVREVVLARQVTHPHVCRVHDIGEIDGHAFLSMELVDGEDLSSLLRRIGRLPHDKGVQLARQIASGLHAAHEKGVLHRDLKPHNVLIDLDGNAKLTDFGVAAVVGGTRGADAASGTPAYLAPELFTGGRPTVQSDLYSLGLVLYEMFCGRRLHDAATMTELLDQHRRPVPPPSTIVPAIDRELEQVILQCLARDPTERPGSALAVLAGLPGGDPLADAAVSGVPPSREVLLESAAASAATVRSARRWLWAAVLGVAAYVWTGEVHEVVARAPLPRSAEVLAHVAEGHLRALGHDPAAAGRARGFWLDRGRLDALARSSAASDRLAAVGDGRPPVIGFWYRSARHVLVGSHLSAPVTWADPPFDEPGMIRLRLDPFGDLRELEVRPEARRTGGSEEPDWAALFSAAGLDQARFDRIEPARAPPVWADRVEAWSGDRGAGDPTAVRVEAASRGGRIVWAQVRERVPGASADDTRPGAAFAAGQLVVMIASVVLAAAWVRRGVADQRGTTRLCSAVFVLVAVLSLLAGGHATEAGVEVTVLSRAAARGLLVGAQFGILYVALEPLARRVWPETVVSSTRLLAGMRRGTRVGRDALAGLAIGAWCLWLEAQARGAAIAAGSAEPALLVAPGWSIEVLDGPAASVAVLLEIMVTTAGYAMAGLLVLVALRAALGGGIAAAAALAAAMAVAWNAAAGDASPWLWAGRTVVAAIAATTLARYGLVAGACATFTYHALLAFPLRLDPGHWQSGPATLLLAVLVVAAWCAHRSCRLAGGAP